MINIGAAIYFLANWLSLGASFSRSPVPPPRKLLLIGWDAADWKLLTPLMEAGEMPHLSRLVEEGAEVTDPRA